MISATEGWAAGQYIGNGGVVVHTTDGGVTWSYSTTFVEEPNYAVRFLDAMHGWVSSNNAVFFTVDGGHTWGEGMGAIGSLYFLEFATLNDGFTTTGQDHGYFRTTDGGHTWRIVRMPRNVANIQFFDANNGVANAADGVYHTTDRGNSWSFTAGRGGTQFFDHNNGRRVFENISERTTDGGATWQTSSLPGWSYDSYFLDPQNGWSTGTGVQVLQTRDGGVSWTVSRQPDTYPYMIYDGWGIDFGDPLHGIAVGGFSGGALRAGGVIFYTSDGGATWLPGHNGSATDTYRIAALDADHAWAANDGSEVLWTTNGGVRWNVSSVPNGGSMHDVEFLDFSSGWVTGGDGIVAHSTDGGRTWVRQFPDTRGQPMYGLDVINSQTVIVVGGGLGAVSERTTDGGNTWTSFDAHNGGILFDVFFINQTTGWIVGNHGGISKSTDGGVTWTAQTSPVISQLSQVMFADENNGWIVGAFSSTVLHTTNGGQTWVVQNAGLPTYASVQGISALSPTTAWISTGATAPPHVKRTTDGGATWIEEATGNDPFNWWSTITFVTPEYGWVGGGVGEPGGGIMRRVPNASTATPTGVPGSATATSLPTFTAVATSTPAATCQPRVVTGSITSNDPVATEFLDFDEIAAECNVPKSCPSTFDGGVAHYDAYTYVNSTASTRCITVVLDGQQCGFDIEAVFSAAYLGSFDPSHACTNYLADPGFYSDPFAGEATYSFNVPAGATFVVVVQEAGEEVGCKNYTVTISGLDACGVTTPTAVVTASPTSAATGTPVVTGSPTRPPSVTVLPTGTGTAGASRTPTPVGTVGATTTPTPVGTTQTTATVSPCAATFADVQPSDYFYVAVQYLYCHGVISGYADGTFRPFNNTTRGQLSKIVVLAEGWTLSCTTQHFSDVPPDNPFYCYIETAYGHGIISGYSDGTFKPGNNVTRGQLSKIAVLAQGWPDSCATQHFSDVPPSNPFYCYVETAFAHGIISGYADGTFRPGNNATRGQISKIVYQAVTGP
jgi:photosystem II stability/assembly factor-like uncharacterized protein